MSDSGSPASTLRCYKCGGIGHKQSECPSFSVRESRPSRFSSATHHGNGKSSSRNGQSERCFVCGKFGHKAKDCHYRYRGIQLRRTSREPVDATYLVCSENCMEVGHIFRNCPNAAKCRRCGEEGHFAKDCSNAVLCRNCFQVGHWAKDCPNEHVCPKCKKTGHQLKECPELERDQEQ